MDENRYSLRPRVDGRMMKLSRFKTTVSHISYSMAQ